MAGGRSARSNHRRPVVVLDEGEADAQHAGLDPIPVEVRQERRRGRRIEPQRLLGGLLAEHMADRRVRLGAEAPRLGQQRIGTGGVPEQARQLGVLQRDEPLQRQAMTRVARTRDLVEDPRRGFVLVAFDVELSQRGAGEDPPGFVVAQGELVGRLFGARRELVRPRELPRGGGHERREPRHAHVIGHPAAGRVRQGLLDHRACRVQIARLDVGTGGGGGEEGQQTAARRSPTDGVQREVQVTDRLPRLPAVLMVLATMLPRSGRVSSPSASGCARRTRSSHDGASSAPSSVISPIRNSTTPLGSVSTNAPPNSWSHRRSALAATSAPSDMLIERRRAARRIRPARSTSPIAMACVSAPSTSRRSSSTRHARSCAARTWAVPSEASRARRKAPNRWW